MEINHKAGQYEKAEAVTYVFTTQEDEMVKVETGIRTKLWQVVPCVCASFSSIPFGLMLGWPSPTNPILLKPDSPINITIDQSAMIAGFLMIGNTVGTPFSTKVFYGSKYGILIGVGFMAIGWFLMWQSLNIYWLLGSRFLVGLGNGYGTGQLKIYISEICDEDLKPLLWKTINFYVYSSLTAIFAFGAFMDFRQTSMVALIATVCVFFLVVFLPSSPAALVKANKIQEARKLIAYLMPGVNINNEIIKIRQKLREIPTQYGLLAIFRNDKLRKNFSTFAILVFCQQFSGAPATIIYTQIMFENSLCPYPIYFAIAYSVVFLISNVFGVFVFPVYKKRTVLLVSSLMLSLVIVVKVCVIYFRFNEIYWTYTSVVVMFLFIIIHTVGLGNVPFTLIPDLFPVEYCTSVTHFFVMFHSMLALIITKIFQVLMSQYNVGVPFCLFLCFSCLAFIVGYFFTK